MIHSEFGIVNSKLGKIGFFDSGFGGLQSIKYFHELYPTYDYLFLADTQNCPYGVKSEEEIRKLAFAGLHRLFDHGATIVILACNTAAAYAIRPRQAQYPDQKVLSITIPGIEALFTRHISGHIGIMATQATIDAGIYPSLIEREDANNNAMTIDYIAAPKLVDIVERGFDDDQEIHDTIHTYMDQFPHPLDYLVLGCTHFPVLMRNFQQAFAGEIINPSYEAASKFGDYLSRHPEIQQTLSQDNSLTYYTTGSVGSFDTIGSKIMGYEIHATHTEIKQGK